MRDPNLASQVNACIRLLIRKGYSPAVAARAALRTFDPERTLYPENHQ